MGAKCCTKSLKTAAAMMCHALTCSLCDILRWEYIFIKKRSALFIVRVVTLLCGAVLCYFHK